MSRDAAFMLALFLGSIDKCIGMWIHAVILNRLKLQFH